MPCMFKLLGLDINAVKEKMKSMLLGNLIGLDSEKLFSVLDNNTFNIC